jgi:hypothetical protein
MKLTLWVAAIGALLSMPFAALAQQAARAADPADPHAGVPPVVYESAIRAGSAAAQPDATPDQLWRAANEAVAGTQDHAAHAHEAQAAPPPPAKPAQRPAADHGKHH